MEIKSVAPIGDDAIPSRKNACNNCIWRTFVSLRTALCLSRPLSGRQRPELCGSVTGFGDLFVKVLVKAVWLSVSCSCVGLCASLLLWLCICLFVCVCYRTYLRVPSNSSRILSLDLFFLSHVIFLIHSYYSSFLIQ